MYVTYTDNMILGDLANIFVIFNSLLYASVIVIYSISSDMFPGNTLLSILRNYIESYLISSNVLLDGFCITNKESLWLSSHQMCFYLDVCFCYLLYKCKLDGINNQIPKSIMDPVNLNIVAHFGHGIGHFMVGYLVQTENNSTINIQSSLMKSIWLVPFWYGFIRAILIKLSAEKQVLISICIAFFQLFLPIRFGFTYVQTILLVLSSVHDLYIPKNKKDIYYTLKACIVNVPIGIVGWIEAYSCNVVLIYMGGHIWYDCTIPISILLYYSTAKLVYQENRIYLKN
jgi:hypothetical protein